MVPAARPVPVAVYFPVFALLITELFGPVNVNAAFRLVNCTSLNTLYAWSCSLMPLFLRPDRYVNVPLEPTYQAAYQGMPAFWRDVLEGLPAPAP